MPKKYKDNAEKQRAYRERVGATATSTKRIIESLTNALDDAGCWKFVKGLPDGDDQAADELCRRLRNVTLVPFRRNQRGEAVVVESEESN